MAGVIPEGQTNLSALPWAANSILHPTFRTMDIPINSPYIHTVGLLARH